MRRLFPTAYHDDPERDREYQQLVRDELLERRLAALATVEATAAADELDEEQLTGWLTALNDLRLVLGTRLDVVRGPGRRRRGRPRRARRWRSTATSACCSARSSTRSPRTSRRPTEPEM